MTIYRNLTPNRNKGQKRVKKGSKIVKILKKLIEIQFFHNFLYNTHKPDRIHYFNHAHMTIYRNLTPNITKGQKRVQNWSEMVKIKKKLIEIQFFHNFLYSLTPLECTLLEWTPRYNGQNSMSQIHLSLNIQYFYPDRVNPGVINSPFLRPYSWWQNWTFASIPVYFHRTIGGCIASTVQLRIAEDWCEDWGMPTRWSLQDRTIMFTSDWVTPGRMSLWSQQCN